MTLTPSEFASRWRTASLSERSGAQSQFLDLCEMLGERHPAAADGTGESFTFEKYVGKSRGGKGYADVWRRDRFAWEYKGKHKDLKKAYAQLNDYREELGNPPLLVVCDMATFQVHTNFTATYKRVYHFTLDDLQRNQVTATCPIPPLEVLRALFDDYNILRPERTDAQVTQDAARLFGRLAERLELEDRNLGASREQVAHFLMRLLFCLFADSIGLLPDHVFRKMVQQDRHSPKKFLRKLTKLFEAMSQPEGVFGEHSIKYFNGGLFDTDSILEMDHADMGILYDVSTKYDWSHVAPAIFGTLFERSLDRERRSLIGAHYTSEEDILTLIEPVLIRPLHRRWEDVKSRVLEALEIERSGEASRNAHQRRRGRDHSSERLLGDWINELTALRVLDPACGSGNFLYVALLRMLDLWLEARNLAAEQGISLVVPRMVSPTQLYGIETEFYAHELASIVVWIGFLQWKHEHGIFEDREPVLQKLSNVEHGDAILRYDSAGKPFEPIWPEANFIIGNPPFLGGKRLRRELGDAYVEGIFKLYENRVPQESDLVVYWFSKALAHAMSGRSRVGLLATQAIRAGANLVVLKEISEKASIFFAWSNRGWLLDGAAIRVSMVGFDDGSETSFQLDGNTVSSINANLTSGADVTAISRLKENSGIAYQGPVKVGKFEIEPDLARKMLRAPRNPNGQRNSDVVIPWLIARDLTDRCRGMHIIDFQTRTETEAALYEMPYEHIRYYVYPTRQKNNRARRKEYWWQHGERNLGMRNALRPLERYIASPRVSKHRFFAFVPSGTLADSRVVVIARSDEYFIGILESSIHLVWSLANSSRHGVGNDITYNIETCFDTFPFPWPPGDEPLEAESQRVRAIADGARELIRLRDNWLNPPGVDAKELKDRTLTNLYNRRPAWLESAHEVLDRAVSAAYGLSYPLGQSEILDFLLQLNRDRASGRVRAITATLPPKKAPGIERFPGQKPSEKTASR